MKRNWKQALGWCVKGLLALTLVGGVWQSPAADAAGTDSIRVAMFLDLGSTYRSTTNAVTLVPETAMTASIKASGGQELALLPAGRQARFSIDGFRVKVLETADWRVASEAAKKLQGTNDKPLLYVDSTSAGRVYQLYTGMYASEQAARDAASRVAQTAAAYLNGQNPMVKGGLHLTAGQFSSAAEADAVRLAYRDAGLEAFTVIVPVGAGKAYEVWVGEAANQADLAAVQSEAGRASSAALQAVRAGTHGLILRQDASLNLDSLQLVEHYTLAGDGQLWIQGNAGSRTQVKERSERTYRGAIEIGSHNGQLYLVNELPLQEYLYSVVGAEVPSSWGAEALKAQAVAARSYALFQGNKFQVANVVDTTLSQAYYGTSYEYPSIIQAVDATAGEVLLSNGRLVEAVFSSNSGGMSADPLEVWGNANPTFGAVESPGDASAQAALHSWYHVVLPSGITGYVREDNVKLTGNTTLAGLPYMTVTANNTNVRPLPLIQSSAEPVARLNPGDTAVVLELVAESNSYEWIRGPFTSEQLVSSLNGRVTGSLPASITSLEVVERGPSGRVLKVRANGQVLEVRYPDLYRSALNGLPSTMFDIEPTGSYTVLGANGAATTVSAGQTVSVISASGTGPVRGAGTTVLNGEGKARIVDNTQRFKFIGRGNGHGLGLSQWGAKGMADQGYDYKQILQHYYRNVTISKE
ncbi:SpoIID/LytB domain-containing protein [Paenibacillus cisolokensis]|uniref:SpoIID/LytB domain-containing protein n=1 Tax=Paenibacillus cisolokensis TaxID=1658519 RepID=UPI003D2A0CE8